MPERSVDVRRVHATDAARIRELRLRMLDDPAAPIAYLDTHAEALARPPEFWQERAIGAALSDEVAQFVAEDGDRWVGSVAVLAPEAGTADYFGREHLEGRAILVSVYVEPAYRGTGLLGRLADAAAGWARDRGRRELALDVHQNNARAQAAYRRLGFTATGGTIEVPSGTEIEMVREIDDPPQAAAR